MTIIGHHVVRERLAQILRNDAVAHAYVFSGPAQIGKVTLARAFATALVTGAKKCDNIVTHVDIAHLQPATVQSKHGVVRTRDIGVEQVRDVIARATQTPLSGRYRVIIIEDADRMTVAAQNALLKTLEEPATQTVLLLTATRYDALLPTVRSRVHHFALTRLDATQMKEIAATFFSANRDCVAACRIAQGRYGVLATIANDKALFDWYKKMLTQWEQFSTMTLAQKVTLAQDLAQDLSVAQRAVIVWIDLWRAQIYDSDARCSIAHNLALAQNLYQDLTEGRVNARLALESFLFNVA